MKLAIGIATYKRPKMLKRSIHSLQNMNTTSYLEICIIIADNDIKGSAIDIIEKLKTEIKYPINYEIEKGRGIPFARNNILRQALKLDVDYLAFIDDDEWVDKDWLSIHWNYMKSSDADVTYSFVKTVYPENTPKWILKGNFFQRAKEKTGKLRKVAYTNNVIFDFKKIVKDWNIYFDESFGLTGGSDVDYFYRVVEKGAVIRHIRHAEVSEELENNRMKASFLFKRTWRSLNNKKIFKYYSYKEKILSLIFFVKGLISLPVNIFRGKAKLIMSLINITKGIAMCFGCFGIFFKWDEYIDKTPKNKLIHSEIK